MVVLIGVRWLLMPPKRGTLRYYQKFAAKGGAMRSIIWNFCTTGMCSVSLTYRGQPRGISGRPIRGTLMQRWQLALDFVMAMALKRT